MSHSHQSNLLDNLEVLRDAQGHLIDPCELLDEVVLLQDMPYQDLSTLGRYFQVYRAKAGVILFKEGERHDILCFLAQGELAVFKEGENGESRQLTTIRTGKSVGEMSFIDNSPPSATVVSEVESILLVLTRHDMERLKDEHPRLAFTLLLKVAQLLSFRLRHTTGKLIDYL